MSANAVNTVVRTVGFYKENGIWYADLPDYLDAGLGTRANLMMVDGADTFLDKIALNCTNTRLKVSPEPFHGVQMQLRRTRNGLNRLLLELIGHAPVEYGAYYEVYQPGSAVSGHILWLCPVTEYVFGNYPDTIHAAVV